MKQTAIERSTQPHKCDECGEPSKFRMLIGMQASHFCPLCFMKILQRMTDVFSKWYRESH